MNRSVLLTYKKLCTEFYDLGPHPRHETALPFYMDYALQAQGPILEPMCGTGRFIIPMLQAGLGAHGFDASPHMLDALKQKYAAITDIPPAVKQAFVQDFSSDTRYQLIFVPYGSWGLIIDQEISKKCLSIMYQHLRPGGKFIIEIETVTSAPQESGFWQSAQCKRDDDSIIELNALICYEKESQIFTSHCRYDLITQGKIVETEKEVFQQYLYQFDEMDGMLAEAGFSSIKKYQDHHHTSATDRNAPLLIYECTK